MCAKKKDFHIICHFFAMIRLQAVHQTVVISYRTLWVVLMSKLVLGKIVVVVALVNVVHYQVI